MHTRHLATALATTALLALGLTACAGEQPTTNVTPDATTAAASDPKESVSTRAPSPTPTAPELDPITFSVECSYEDPSLYNPNDVNSSPADSYVREVFPSYEAAWASGKPWASCEGSKSGGTDYTGEQVAATQAAGYDSVESVDTLYGLCAEVNGFYVTDGPVSVGQQAEIAGMLMICPDFPSADKLRAASAEAQKAEEERAAGLRFWGSGVYIVGQDVQPGTFVATGDIKNCYWERLDAAGETVDNNFVVAATRVELTIAPTDYSVSIDGGCGEWVANR